MDDNLNSAKLIAKSYLTEMFDHPYTTEFDPIKTEEKKQEAKDSGYNVRYLRCHKIEGGRGHIMTYHRDGHTEIHHMNKDEISGKTTGEYFHDPRWVGMMYHHIMDHCLSGDKSCKIIAPYDPDNRKSLHYHYKRFAARLAKRHDKDIVHGEETIGVHRLGAIIIQPKNKLHSIFKRDE